ncbi:unnamed protein product [Peniophora sp. CBMAI 1063]|nr:unnamed protein product [Peniophora sp. CBMAI 1063]
MQPTFDNIVSPSKVMGYHVLAESDTDSDDCKHNAPPPSPLSSRYSHLSAPLSAPSIDNNTTIDSISGDDSANGWTLVESNNERRLHRDEAFAAHAEQVQANRKAAYDRVKNKNLERKAEQKQQEALQH